MIDKLAIYLGTMAALAPTWGFLLVFAFMAIESSFIPFPSEIVMIPAGFLAARGELTTGMPCVDLILVTAIGTIGSVAGAYFNYVLAQKLGEPFLRKYGKWFFLKPEALTRSEEIFKKYGSMATFTCRLIPVIRQLISIPAGLSGMPLKSFFFFTALGAGIWSFILAAVGFGIGRQASDMTWVELVHKGKSLVDDHLIWIILAAVSVAVIHTVISKIVMRRK